MRSVTPRTPTVRPRSPQANTRRALAKKDSQPTPVSHAQSGSGYVHIFATVTIVLIAILMVGVTVWYDRAVDSRSRDATNVADTLANTSVFPHDEEPSETTAYELRDVADPDDAACQLLTITNSDDATEVLAALRLCEDDVEEFASGDVSVTLTTTCGRTYERSLTSGEETIREDSCDGTGSLERIDVADVPIAEQESNATTELVRAFVTKYPEVAAEDVTISDLQATDTLARGMVSFGEEGGWFFAAVLDGEWSIVDDGNGAILCDVVEPFGFPSAMIEDCVREES